MRAADRNHARITMRPRDSNGRETAWFAYSDTENAVDYNLFRPGAVDDAIRFRRCWCCGEHRGKHSTYIASPAILVDGQSNEPPSHSNCALHAATHCPFLTGIQQDGNDRVVVLYTSTQQPLRVTPSSTRFWAGPPTSVSWFCRGREATRDEAVEALESAYAAMRRLSQDQAEHLDKLERLYGDALRLLP